jgi:maltose alpha-D-glucosyltransferase / alpha-amylase
VVNRTERRFTMADKPVTPVIAAGLYGYQHINAAEQRRDPNLMLNWTDRIIHMRKEVHEVGTSTRVTMLHRT